MADTSPEITADIRGVSVARVGDLVNMERPWIGEPGQYHYGNEVGLGGEWLTVEEAAEEFNVTVRGIRERYRPEMPDGTYLGALTEIVYTYDFEDPEYEWG